VAQIETRARERRCAARLAAEAAVASKSGVTPPPLPPGFEEKLIVGWSMRNDQPHYEDRESFVHIEPRCKINEGDRWYHLLEDNPLWQPLAGDHVSGFPYWVQSAQWGECRICKRRMDLVMSLDGLVLPYEFGEHGTAQLFQCPAHKDVLCMGWSAC
jgi:hypothetical protein